MKRLKQNVMIKISSGNMKPGRELDTLIAKKVMHDVVRYMKMQPTTAMIAAGTSTEDIPIYKDNALNPRRYSTDITDAWIIVKTLKLRIWPTDKGRWFVEQSKISEDYGDEYWFGGDSFLEDRKGLIADTAPHAICLAALKAITDD